jgi:hypothetical protein
MSNQTNKSQTKSGKQIHPQNNQIPQKNKLERNNIRGAVTLKD